MREGQIFVQGGLFVCLVLFPYTLGPDILLLLTVQLKVNLRLLWSAGAEALASLSLRFGDIVWELMFGAAGGLANAGRGSRYARIGWCHIITP